MSTVLREAARVTRYALNSWGRTLRLCLILMFLPASGAAIMIVYLVLRGLLRSVA